MYNKTFLFTVYGLLNLTLSYTAIIGIVSFTAVAENGQCKNNGI